MRSWANRIDILVVLFCLATVIWTHECLDDEDKELTTLPETNSYYSTSDDDMYTENGTQPMYTSLDHSAQLWDVILRSARYIFQCIRLCLIVKK